MSVGCTYHMVVMWGKEFKISAVPSSQIQMCLHWGLSIAKKSTSKSTTIFLPPLHEDYEKWEWWSLDCPFVVQNFAIERGPKITLHCIWVYNSFLVCWNTWFITVYVIHFVADFGVVETALKNSISSRKVGTLMAYINVPFPIRGFMKFTLLCFAFLFTT